MGNDKSRPAGDNRFQRLLNITLRFCIECRRGFIKNENRGVFEKCPGDGEPLSLAPRQEHTIITHNRIQARLELVDKISGISMFSGAANVPLRR